MQSSESAGVRRQSQYRSQGLIALLKVGLSNVLLKDIEVVICSGCKGESPRISNHDDVMRTIAVALVAKPHELAGDVAGKYYSLAGRPRL